MYAKSDRFIDDLIGNAGACPQAVWSGATLNAYGILLKISEEGIQQPRYYATKYSEYKIRFVLECFDLLSSSRQLSALIPIGIFRSLTKAAKIKEEMLKRHEEEKKG